MMKYPPIVIQSKAQHTHTDTHSRVYGTGCGAEGESAAGHAAASAPCCTLVLCGRVQGLILQEETSLESQLEEMGGMRVGGRKRAGGEGLRPHVWLGHPSLLALILSPLL